jgi:hypothetical protein
VVTGSVGRPDPTTWVRVTAKLWLGLVVLFSLARGALLGTTMLLDGGSVWSTARLLGACAFGVRLDMSVASWLLAPCALASLLWIKHREQSWMKYGSLGYRAYGIAVYALCWTLGVAKLPYGIGLAAAGIALGSWYVVRATRLSTLRLAQGNRPRRTVLTIAFLIVYALSALPWHVSAYDAYPGLDDVASNPLLR